jgi:hypothetical protein
MNRRWITENRKQITDNRFFCLLISVLCLLSSVFCPLFSVFSQEEGIFIYDDKGRRDPFRALVDENGQYLLEEDRYYSSDELEVSGILWDPSGKSSALINNQIAAVGEVIFGFMVEDITKDAVTLSKDGKEYIIRLSIEQ